MRALIALWLIFSTRESLADTTLTEKTLPKIDITVDDLTKAPIVSDYPAGLPKSRKAGRDGVWLDNTVDDAAAKTDVQAGTFLPSPLDLETHRRLRILETLPGVFQIQLDELILSLNQGCAGRIEVSEAKCVAEAIQNDVAEIDREGWPTWQVLLIAGGSVLLTGFVVGFATK